MHIDFRRSCHSDHLIIRKVILTDPTFLYLNFAVHRGGEAENDARFYLGIGSVRIDHPATIDCRCDFVHNRLAIGSN